MEVYHNEIMGDPEGKLEPVEVEMMISATTDDKEKLLLLVLWGTGSRVSEALRLKKANFDFKDSSIRVPTLKRRRKGQFRTIPIDPNIMLYIKAQLEPLKRNELVFKYNRQKAWRIVKKCADRAGIGKRGKKSPHPHMFRHSYGVRATKAGVPLKVTSEILGHASLQTTSFYQRFTTRESKEFVKKMWKKS